MIKLAKHRWRRYLVWLVPAFALLVPVLLCILYPNTWRPYIAYSLGRVGLPLVGLFFALILLALLFVFFLRYRRKSELLAACLALSIALHMLIISMMSIWVIKQMIYELVQEAEKYDLTVGLPSLIESAVSQTVREKLLEMGLIDTHTFEAKKRTSGKFTEVPLTKSQPKMYEPQLGPAHEDIEIEQISKPEQKVEEKLEALQEKQPEVTTMKIAMIDQVEDKREDQTSHDLLREKIDLEPVQADKTLDVMAEPVEKPGGLKLKEIIRVPTREEIDIAGERTPAHDVEEIIKGTDAVVGKTADRLALPLKEVTTETEPMGTEDKTVREPQAGFHLLPLSPQVKMAPKEPSPKMITLEIENIPAKISSASLADTDLKRVEPRPKTDTSVITTLVRTNHVLVRRILRTEPDFIKDTLDTVAHVTPVKQSHVSQPLAPEEMHVGRRKGGFADALADIEKARAEIEVATKPLAEETLLKPAREEIAQPRLEASQPKERLAEFVVIESLPRPVMNLAGTAALLERREDKVEQPAKVRPQLELAALKAETQIEEAEMLPVPQHVKAAPEVTHALKVEEHTLVEPERIAEPESRAPTVKEDMAESFTAELIEEPVVYLGRNMAAAQTEQKVVERVEQWSDIKELVALKAKTDAAPSVDELTAAHLSVPDEVTVGEPAHTEQVAADMKLDSADATHVGLEVPSEISAADVAVEEHKPLISFRVTPPFKSISKEDIYKLRAPEKRKKFIEELGGSPESEEAVEQALKWLSKSQSDDGRWDVDGFKLLTECGGAGDRKDGDVAVTGLSLLAYLGAGYTHIEGEYKETVRKAFAWLLAGQKADGDLRRGGQMYGQAMATAAICEAYSMTRDKWLLPAAERAVNFILFSQNPGAGWRYQPKEDNDTSVVGWQILALKSAAIAGINVPKIHYEWAGAWLDKVRKGEKGGLYSYKPGDPATHIMTAEGWFCQLFMSEETRMRGVSESIDYIMKNLPQWSPDSGEVPHLYYWYYATLSLHLSGNQEFERWNAALSRALLKGRVKDGVGAGSWDPVCQLGTRGGRIYSTAMATLCLEVYYRYLPFYKQE